MLLALGSSLWMAGQAIWTYVEIHQHRHTPYLFNGYHFNVDIVFYLARHSHDCGSRRATAQAPG